MTTDLAGLERKLNDLADDITGKALRAVLNKSGVEGKKIADQSVQAALGDMSFSRWRPGKQIQIRTRFDHTSDTSITFKPAGKSTGPWTVLEHGRRGGKHGTTRGRGAWSDAVREMERKLPEEVGDHVRKALRKQFGS